MSDNKYHLQHLARALQVLFVFSAGRSEWSLEDLASELKLNKTSLLRIVRTLENERFLLRRGQGYRLGPRVLDLANVYLSTLTVNRVAQPYMEKLAKVCQQTVSLATLEGTEVVYIAIEQAQSEVGIQSEIGGRHPAHATALGKVMLADLSDAEVLERYAGVELKRLTHRTLNEVGKLVDRLHEVRRLGYALDDEERGIGIRCIAAPLYGQKGEVVAGLSLAGPIFHMTEDVIPAYLKALLEATEGISHELGYGGVAEAELVLSS
ncbi:IclR family transcriptional regulator [soil metagenome]